MPDTLPPMADLERMLELDRERVAKPDDETPTTPELPSEPDTRKTVVGFVICHVCDGRKTVLGVIESAGGYRMGPIPCSRCRGEGSVPGKR